MAVCEVRWRPSGGRGEFEFVPADSLMGRDVYVTIEPLEVLVDAEVVGLRAQGKPRLRKRDRNNRDKLHLPQLVMAIVALPEPARSDQGTPSLPLENKGFVIGQMDFDVVEDDGAKVVLRPLSVSILHSGVNIRLDDRVKALADDVAKVDEIRERDNSLAEAIEAHVAEISKAVNSSAMRTTADRLIELKSELFGQTNAGSAHVLVEADAKAKVEHEEIVGQEGRILTRIHVYKERDARFVRQAKEHYREKNGGRLVCEVCGNAPIDTYGDVGDRAIEAHHKIPIEELQPDSETRVEDLAIVCSSCHRVIHSRKPCLTIEEVRELIVKHRT